MQQEGPHNWSHFSNTISINVRILTNAQTMIIQRGNEFFQKKMFARARAYSRTIKVICCHKYSFQAHNGAVFYAFRTERWQSMKYTLQQWVRIIPVVLALAEWKKKKKIYRVILRRDVNLIELNVLNSFRFYD